MTHSLIIPNSSRGLCHTWATCCSGLSKQYYHRAANIAVRSECQVATSERAELPVDAGKLIVTAPTQRLLDGKSFHACPRPRSLEGPAVNRAQCPVLFGEMRSCGRFLPQCGIVASVKKKITWNMIVNVQHTILNSLSSASALSNEFESPCRA